MKIKIISFLIFTLTLFFVGTYAEHLDDKIVRPSELYPDIVYGITNDFENNPYDDGETKINDAAAFVIYKDNGNYKLQQYIWHYTYARPSDATYTSLSEYSRGKWVQLDWSSGIKRINEGEKWLVNTHSSIITISLDDLDNGDVKNWLIFPAGCVLRTEAQQYEEVTGNKWFYKQVDSISNDQWLCGFNHPIEYNISVENKLPDGFEGTP